MKGNFTNQKTLKGATKMKVIKLLKSKLIQSKLKFKKNKELQRKYL